MNGAGTETSSVTLEQALDLYQAGKVPPGRAAAMAGIDRWKFAEIAKTRGIKTPYTLEMVEEDFANASRH